MEIWKKKELHTPKILSLAETLRTQRILGHGSPQIITDPYRPLKMQMRLSLQEGKRACLLPTKPHPLPTFALGNPCFPKGFERENLGDSCGSLNIISRFETLRYAQGPLKEAANAEHWQARGSGSGGTSLLVSRLHDPQAVLEPIRVYLCLSVSKGFLCLLCDSSPANSGTGERHLFRVFPISCFRD